MPEIMKPKVSMEWDDKATLLGGRFVKVYRCADCNRQLHLELPAGIDTHIATQKGASMNIPEFYDSWRERTELQHEIERLRAERKVEHELETDLESGCVAAFDDCDTCPVFQSGACPSYGSSAAPDPEEIAKWLNAEVAA